MEASQAQWHFFGLGMQYYAVARYGALAGFVPVCGNLFHHAIEMFLKGGLSSTHTLKQLRSFGRTGHELPPLWVAFKADFSSAILEQFDDTINALGQFETIRYPDKITKEIDLRLSWEPGTASSVYRDEITPSTYRVVVPHIDHLVATIFEVCSVDPRFYVGTLNVYAHDAIAQNNPDCGWLSRP